MYVKPNGQKPRNTPLCVIPARRGSKRLPLKNLRPLCGKPMIAYSIMAALESGVFDKVFVSTEDGELAEIAAAYGAVVHRRRDELAGDLVSATDVCLDVAESLAAEGRQYDSIACLQPTSPLRTSEEIRGAWEKFEARKSDFFISVTPIDPHYFHWAVHQTPESGWRMFFGDEFMLERPLLPAIYRPNGSIKIARTAALWQRRNFFGPLLEVFVTPEERSVHVAEAFDFQVAEFLLARRLAAAQAPA